MTKLCVNCKHCLPSEVLPKDLEYSRCGFERPISLVTGLLAPNDKLPYCAVQRLKDAPCKIDGVLWEAAFDVMTPEEEEEMLKEAKYV